MISIIVSTYKPDNFSRFEENIRHNIGVDYELIQIHNDGKFGLCEAYNIGVEKAKYPYICFSHDDILINKGEWGQEVVDIFMKNEQLGLLGIAGSTYKSWVPSGWFFPYDFGFCCMDMWQADNNKLDNKIHYFRKPSEREENNEVVTLDGSWFCTTKEIAKEFKFDQDLLKGYHCYDLDYSLQIGSKYKIEVLYGLELIHFSRGEYKKDWVIESFKLHQKWEDRLPIYIHPIDTLEKSAIAQNEFKAFRFLLDKTYKNGVSLKPILKLLYTPKLIKLVGLPNWFKLQKWTWGAVFRRLNNK